MLTHVELLLQREMDKLTRKIDGMKLDIEGAEHYLNLKREKLNEIIKQRTSIELELANIQNRQEKDNVLLLPSRK